jgi:hypothetical protein
LGKHLILRKERRLQPICVGSPPAVLLRESYRDGGKVKTRTLANLTDWPDAKVDALRRVLKGETAIVSQEELAASPPTRFTGRVASERC